MNLSAVSASLRNTAKCFPNIFFNNEMMQLHLLPRFFTGINKRLTCLTILLRSVGVLPLHRIPEPIEA